MLYLHKHDNMNHLSEQVLPRVQSIELLLASKLKVGADDGASVQLNLVKLQLLKFVKSLHFGTKLLQHKQSVTGLLHIKSLLFLCVCGFFLI